MRWIVPLLWIGCAEEKAEPPELTITETETCGGTPPVIESLVCENTGMQFDEDEGRDLPTLSFYVNVTDEDADMTSYDMLVEFDTSIDNALDADALRLGSISGALSTTPCSVSRGDIGVTVFLNDGGGPPELTTTYEWYVSIFDSAGDRSDPAMIVCTTPDENGNGDPN